MHGKSKLGQMGRFLVSVAAVVALGLATMAAPVAAVPDAGPGRADALQASRSLRQVIRLVEKSELPCSIRNTVVKRLRLADDALNSGRRSGARSLLRAWAAKAARMRTAGTLDAPTSSMLQQRLSVIAQQAGTGWPEKLHSTPGWPRLAKCDSSPLATSTGGEYDYEVWTPGDMQVLINSIIWAVVPTVPAAILTGLISILWPNGIIDDDSTSSVYDLIPANEAQSRATTALNKMFSYVDTFQDSEDNWIEYCNVPTPSDECPAIKSDLRTNYLDAVQNGRALSTEFQQNDVAGDFRVSLLATYAQYETAYISLLREGLLYGGPDGWGLASTTIRDHKDYLGDQLNPDNKLDGIGYIDEIYELGMPPDPKPAFGGVDEVAWKTQNEYVRYNTLYVLDFREMWPSLNPVDIDLDVDSDGVTEHFTGYPNGNPGFKLDRMIYSDPIGSSCIVFSPTRCNAFSPPSNVDRPLWVFEVWAQDQAITTANIMTQVVDAMRLYSSDVTTPIMGDSTLEPGWGPTHHLEFDVNPGVDGYKPITAVRGMVGKDTHSTFVGPFLQGLEFQFSNTNWLPNSAVIGSFTSKDSFQKTPVPQTGYFAYEDEVIASARIMGPYGWGYDNYSADAVVFGFRYGDTF